MPKQSADPSDPARKKPRSRVALWLSPEDLLWLSKHCCCPADATEEERTRCARLRSGAEAALQKSGLIPQMSEESSAGKPDVPG